jgi:SAM-dependent methyltransferase
MSLGEKSLASLPASAAVDQARADQARQWVQNRYYSDAESDGWLRPFWGAEGPFLRQFAQLDLADVVELACGYGRHATRYVADAGHVTLVDITADSISACRRRFEGQGNVSCFVNNGFDLRALESGRYSAVMSYDAMVHFEATDVISYIYETARVLRPGGKALMHYSNFQGRPEGTYADGPHWRSFFSETLFRHFASRAGLRVIHSELLTWPPHNGERDLDALTLVERAS